MNSLSIIVVVALLQAVMVTAIVPPSSVATLSERKAQLMPPLAIRGGGEEEGAMTASMLSRLIPGEMVWAKGLIVLFLVYYSAVAFAPDLVMGDECKRIKKGLKSTTLSPAEIFRAGGIGWSGLSVVVTAALLLFASESSETLISSPWSAVVIGAMPRYIQMAKALLTAKFVPGALDVSSLVPVYSILAVLFAAMLTEAIPIQPALAVKIVGGVYTFAGIVCMLLPEMVAQQTSKESLDKNKNPFDIFLVREQGKADVINGGLLWGVGLGYSATKSIGAGQLAWLLSILVGDVMPSLLFRSDIMGNSMAKVIIGLVLAAFGSKLLLFSPN